MTTMNQIGRAALGSTASIGQLYDARADKFLGISIFKKDVPPNCVTKKDNHFSDIQLVQSDDFTDKFHKLNVKAELQVSVLAGLVTLEGSGRFLKDQKNSARTVKSSLVYKIKTADEMLNIHHEDLKDAFSLDAIRNGGGTHVVVGISWGADCVLSCQYTNKEERDRKEIEGALSATLQQVTWSVSGKASVDFGEGNDANGINFEIRIYGDILPNNNEPLPTTVEGGMEFMKQLPSLVQNCNNGMGKPMKYMLLPISLLKDYLKFNIAANMTLRSLEEASLLRVVKVFEEINAVKQKLNDFHQDVMEHPSCVTVQERTEIISVKEEVLLKESGFRTELGQLLVRVRSGASDAAEIEALLTRFRGGNYSPHKVQTMLETWKVIWTKIRFAKEIENLGAKYIGVGDDLEEELVKAFNLKSFILYFTKDKLTEPQVWAKNRQLFLQKLNDQGDGFAYFAVDCEFHPDRAPKDKHSCVQVQQRGAVLSEDLLEDYERLKSLPVAGAPAGTIRTRFKPNNRVPLSIRCTGITCDPKIEYDWQCLRCTDELEWGFDEHVYCTCGKTPVALLEFKCPHPDHSVNFEKHDPAYLKELLGELKAFPEMNILIMGETGVGKSTFINAFRNFVSFETLDEAVAHKDLLSLIVTKFTMTDEDFNEVTVTTGTDKNEIQLPGQSATQKARIYSFPMGKTMVRLIDTPGIGDSRGVDQDKKNFKSTLDTISKLDELHGICILLKPNNSRLTVMFRFCIKELLTHLHRDASKNIVFCFTNARGTFYKPGDTMPPLRALLNENKDVRITLSRQTVYCFDSESFRFLAAVKNKPPVTFPDDEKKNYSLSWDKSRNETRRLLEHIRTLRPHPVKSTLGLNDTREMVLKFTRPLAEISRVIQINKEVAQDMKTAIELTDEDIKKLRTQLMTTKTEIETTALDYPMTVCSNSACVKTWTVRGTNQKVQEYAQVCHDHCYLDGIKRDTIGDPGLMGCDAINQHGMCRRPKCGHMYREHLHVYYESKQVTKTVEDEATKALIAGKLSAKETKRLMILAKDTEIKEYEAEQKAIEEASAKFAYFLKKNAINAYNDEMEKYLMHHIEQERDKVNLGKKAPTTLHALEKNLASYLQEKKILEDAMEKGDGTHEITSDQIKDIALKLKGLKHHGKNLVDALNCIDRIGTRVVQVDPQDSFVTVPIPPASSGKSDKKWWQFWRWGGSR